MDKTTGLEYLPSEVIEYIARYLSVQDIVACCATSSVMRHVFSGDFVWKRKCNLELVDYLEKSECLVEPNYDWTEVMDDELSTLSPLSDWRKCYMMQVRLFLNWRQGRYEREKIELRSRGIYKSIGTFYQNDHIIVHGKELTDMIEQIELWDVKDSQLLLLTFNFNLGTFIDSETNPIVQLLNNRDYREFKIVGNKLVVSMGNIVIIHDLYSFSSIPFSQLFFFDFSEEDSKCLISLAKSEPRTRLPIKTQVESIICNNYFVGIVDKESLIHIWDIQSGKKVAVEACPLDKIDKMYLIKPVDETFKFVIKVIVPQTKFSYHYYGYDLIKMEFSSFKLKHNYCHIKIVSDKFVIGSHSKQLYSYNYETSEQLATRRNNYEILRDCLSYVGCNLLCGTVDNVIFVMDPFTLNIINSVKLSFTLYTMVPICNRFVMLNTYDTEVWEIGKTIKLLFKLPCNGSFTAINQTCTKIAFTKNNKINILNFW